MARVELTDRFCRTAKATVGRQVEFFDTIVRGLSLIASDAGTKTFWLHYTRPGDGKRARLRLGRYPEIGLAAAREKARGARGDIGEGTDPLVKKRAKAAAQTVAELVESYLARAVAEKRSVDEIRRRLVKNVSAVVGNIKVSDLHRRDLTKCIDLVKDRGASTEASRVYEDLRALVRWAKGRGDLDLDLVSGMRRPSEPVVRNRVLSADEIKAVWRALPDADMSESVRRILRLCFITAQRVGEISGMRRSEIDLEQRLWVIPAERAKNGHEHAVPLSDMAIEIIKAQLAAVEKLSKRMQRPIPDAVFPGRGARQPLPGVAVARAIVRVRVAKKGKVSVLGVPDWTAHDARRSVSTAMEEMGVSPHVIGHVLNHRTTTRASVTSAVYARYSYDAEKREALDLWADRLAAIVSGEDKVIAIRAAA